MRISRKVLCECFVRVFYQNKKLYMSEWLIRSRERVQSITSYTNRGYIPIRFITGSLGVRTRRRRRKLLTASCSLLLLRDWRVSSRTSSRSSPTLELGMGREAQRSEQEHCSPVSITRTKISLPFTWISLIVNGLCKLKQKCLNGPIYRKNNPRLRRVGIAFSFTF